MVELQKLSDEPVTLKIAVPQDVNVGDWAENSFTKWYEEKTNVKVEWQVLAGTEDERRAAANAIIAGGDLPDMFMGIAFQPAQIQLYGQQGLFVKLNDIIDQNCNELLFAFSSFPQYRDLITTSDGSIYAFPNINDCYHCAGSMKMWINKEWLDKLGLAVPQRPTSSRLP